MGKSLKRSLVSYLCNRKVPAPRFVEGESQGQNWDTAGVHCSQIWPLYGPRGRDLRPRFALPSIVEQGLRQCYSVETEGAAPAERALSLADRDSVPAFGSHDAELVEPCTSRMDYPACTGSVGSGTSDHFRGSLLMYIIKS